MNLVNAIFPNAPSFLVKRSANQTGIADITWTKVQFDSEDVDKGGYFDAVTNYGWTPPAGKVFLTGNCYMTGTISANILQAIAIGKDGAIVSQCSYPSVSNTAYHTVSYYGQASGANLFTLSVYVDVSGGTAAFNTGFKFAGLWLSP